MDPERRLQIAFGLLVPALVAFSVRAALQLAGEDVPGVVLALVGIASGAGMLLAVATLWPTVDRWRALAAVAVALLGHYVVADFIDHDLGGAMVYLGTGFLASLRVRWAQMMGLLAGVGALLRGEVAMGVSHGMLMAGALGIAAALILAMARMDATQTPSSDAAD